MGIKRQLTDLQKSFLDHLCGEAKGSIRKAMRLAGYSDNVKESEVVDSLKDEMIDAAKNVLARNAAKAAFGLVDGLDTPNELGMKNKIAAAEKIMDRVGLTKESGESKTEIHAENLVILPEKKS